MALVLLALVAGCAEEELTPTGKLTKKATPTPGITGGIGGATPTPSPTPPGNTGTDVHSQIDTNASVAAVPTLAPNTQPTPSPTPLGTAGLPFSVGGAPRGIAFLTNAVTPFVLRSSDVVGLDADMAIRTPYDASIDQPVALAADGAQYLWVLSHDHVDRLRSTSGELSLAVSVAIPSGTSLSAGSSEAWITTSDGKVRKISSSGTVSTFTGYPSLTESALDATYAWVSGAGSTVYRIRRSDGASTSVTVGGTPTALATAADGALWCVHGTSATRVANDLSTTSVTLAGAGRAVAADAARVWFALPSGLAYYSLGGQPQGDVDLTFAPDALAFDAYNRLWALSNNGDGVAVWGK